jgi:hypothetical protein
MLRVLTSDEIEAGDDRRRFLYTSPFTLDNLTAILMDPSKGSFGMYESTARVKAHEVLSWLATISGVDITSAHQPCNRGGTE